MRALYLLLVWLGMGWCLWGTARGFDVSDTQAIASLELVRTQAEVARLDKEATAAVAAATLTGDAAVRRAKATFDDANAVVAEIEEEGKTSGSTYRRANRALDEARAEHSDAKQDRDTEVADEKEAAAATAAAGAERLTAAEARVPGFGAWLGAAFSLGLGLVMLSSGVALLATGAGRKRAPAPAPAPAPTPAPKAPAPRPQPRPPEPSLEIEPDGPEEELLLTEERE